MEDIEVVSSSDDKSQNRNLNASFSLDHLNDLLIDWSFFYELIKFMPEISRFLGIIIKMFIKEHNPPHFHAFYGEYAAVFSIETGQMIQGDLPAKKSSFSNSLGNYSPKRIAKKLE